MKSVEEHISKFPKEWKEVVPQMFKDGAAIIEVLSYLKTTRHLHGRFMNEDETYREIFLRGEVDSEAWWRRLGRANVTETKFNARLYEFMIKAQFGVGQGEGTPKDAVFNDKNKEAELLAKYNNKSLSKVIG